MAQTDLLSPEILLLDCKQPAGHHYFVEKNLPVPPILDAIYTHMTITSYSTISSFLYTA